MEEEEEEEGVVVVPLPEPLKLDLGSEEPPLLVGEEGFIFKSENKKDETMEEGVVA